MTVVAAIAESVGLQILLQPSSSKIVFRAACSVVGVAYPVYESLKTVEAPPEAHPQRDPQWLTYWAIYSSFALLEQHSTKLLEWFPWYWHVKFAFLLWLQLPTFQGARRLYTRFVRPTLLRYQPHIDDTLHQLHATLARPEVVAVGHSARKAALSVPLLGWFARTPAEDEALLEEQEAAEAAFTQSPPRRRRRQAARQQQQPESQWDHVERPEGSFNGGDEDDLPQPRQSWGQRWWGGRQQ